MAVIPGLRHGSAERVLSLLSLEWTKAHDVTIVAFDASRPAYCYGGKVIDLKLARPLGPAAKIRVVCLSTLRLMLAFRRCRPDRIVGFMEPANLPSTVAATGCFDAEKLVVSVHHDPYELPRIRWILMVGLYRLPALVVAVSRGVAGALAALSICRQRVVTISNPAVPVRELRQACSISRQVYPGRGTAPPE